MILNFSRCPKYKYSVLILVLLFFVGCSSLSSNSNDSDLTTNEEYQSCRHFFTKLDQAVQQSGVTDASATQIKHYPWLRANRFLASFGNEKLNREEFSAWIDRLQQLDLVARNAENQNLSSNSRKVLGFNNGFELNTATSNCSSVMRTHDIQNTENLRKAIKVPTEYQSWKRVLGIYPLTSLGVFIGANKLKKEIKTTFSTNANENLLRKELNIYSPQAKHLKLHTQTHIAEILKTSANNPLGIPEPNSEQRKKLFATFAPVWAIDTNTEDDLIGQPAWLNDKTIINTNKAYVYQLISHTRNADKILLQLNYIIWFPARTLTSHFDILGGKLDGITWRVTLDEDGSPLLYDSMHNCGCYHKFFPSNRLQQKPKQGYEEALFVPAAAPNVKVGQRVVIKVANLTHYIEAIKAYSDKQILNATDTHYLFENYEKLKTMRHTRDTTRSLFRPDGIIADTERLERWILWPMGIPEPGAMRQWGHHATAFVGQRHFDDPNLIERYFQYKEPE